MQWRLALEDGYVPCLRKGHSYTARCCNPIFHSMHFCWTSSFWNIRGTCNLLAIIAITFLFSLARGAVCPQVARALKLHTHSRFARLVVPAPPRLIYMRAGIQPIFIFKCDIFSNCCPRSQSSLCMHFLIRSVRFFDSMCVFIRPVRLFDSISQIFRSRIHRIVMLITQFR